MNLKLISIRLLLLFVTVFLYLILQMRFVYRPLEIFTVLEKVDKVIQNSGGFGIRKNVDVSLPVFLSSVHGTEGLTRKILINELFVSEVSCKAIVIDAWQIACPITILPANACSYGQWDTPLCILKQKRLLDTSTRFAES